jgi:hypothetical protein
VRNILSVAGTKKTSSRTSLKLEAVGNAAVVSEMSLQLVPSPEIGADSKMFILRWSKKIDIIEQKMQKMRRRQDSNLRARRHMISSR